MSTTKELVTPVAANEEGSRPAVVDDDDDTYYKLLMSRVDETIEETKREKERRSTDVEAHATTSDGSSYIVEFFVSGVSPLQAMAALSDPDNMRYINPRVLHVSTVKEERDDATGMDYLELKLRYRRLVCCCVPMSTTLHVKYCLEKDRDELVCHERHGWTEKHHKYTFEEEDKGTRVVDTVTVKQSRCSRLLSGPTSPLSSEEHLRCMQRLKKILEADDDPFLPDDNPSAKLLFTDL